MIGLVIAGPWLTMTGARVLARRASRPGTLIAARRLADDPRAAFRAVSGLVLALFIFTVAAALIATQDTKPVAPTDGAAANNTLIDQFSNLNGGSAAGSAPPPPATVLTRLRHIPGVQGVIEFRADPGLTITNPQLQIQDFPAAAVSCAQLASDPGLGRCPAGAAAAKVPASLTDIGGGNLAEVTSPAADVAGAAAGQPPAGQPGRGDERVAARDRAGQDGTGERLPRPAPAPPGRREDATARPPRWTTRRTTPSSSSPRW